MPTSSEEKKKWLNDIVGKILDKIVLDSYKDIVFTSLGSRNSRVILLVEVKFTSKETALKIRKGFFVKKEQTRISEEYSLQTVSHLLPR